MSKLCNETRSIPDAQVGWFARETRTSQVYLHSGPYERVLASASASRIKAADCLHHSLWEISVFNHAIWSCWSTSCVPIQRLMNTVLADISAFSKAYLDDVSIFSNSWKDHLVHLDEVLSQLEREELTVKACKCRLGRQECQCLGHVIGNGRVRQEQNKINAVRNFERPKKKKDVRTFLYFAGYYRKFIPRFSETAIPLTDATKKDAPDKWTSSMEAAFQQLKQQLASDVDFASPNKKCSFMLQTDASDVGIAGFLSQADDSGDDWPITYFNRKLLPREQRYSAVELECLAFISSVQHFGMYLTGIEFTVQTHHKCLQYLHRLKDENSRLTPWALALQPYDFRVQHRPGKANANADGLSRKAWMEDAECRRRGEECQGAPPSTLASRAPWQNQLW